MMAIDQPTYQRWWALHLRAARGESLGSEDQAFYESISRQLEQQETLTVPGLREAHAAVLALESERSRLEARRQQLDAEIANLEAASSRC